MSDSLYVEQSSLAARPSGKPSPLSWKTALLCQRIQQEQGFLIMRSNIEQRAGDVVTECYANALGRQGLLPPLVVIGPATLEDFVQQALRYSEDKTVSGEGCRYYYKVIAE